MYEKTIIKQFQLDKPSLREEIKDKIELAHMLQTFKVIEKLVLEN